MTLALSSPVDGSDAGIRSPVDVPTTDLPASAAAFQKPSPQPQSDNGTEVDADRTGVVRNHTEEGWETG